MSEETKGSAVVSQVAEEGESPRRAFLAAGAAALAGALVACTPKKEEAKPQTVEAVDAGPAKPKKITWNVQTAWDPEPSGIKYSRSSRVAWKS